MSDRPGGLTTPANPVSGDTGRVVTLPPTIVRARRVPATPRRLEAPEPLEAPAEPGETYDFPIPFSRSPRAGISVNGTRLDRWLVSLEATNNRYFTADSFTATLALREADKEFGLPFWSDQGSGGKLDVEFFVSLSDESEPDTSILAGRVDDLRISLGKRTITLTGRDHTADLIEARIAEKYQNQTSSQIVETLASRYGLTARATPTKALAGTYYAHEHASLKDETNAWNLITYLAEREGFDAYVRGRELYFGPPPKVGEAPVWTLTYEPSDGEDQIARAPAGEIEFSRSLTASRDVAVKVISWSSGKKKAITGQSRSRQPARGNGGQFQAAATHVFRLPGLTQEQADREAERLHKEITSNMRAFSAELPGDPRVTTETIVRVRGTGGSFDCDYYLDEVIREVSQSGGFEMRLRGRNIVADDTAAL